MNTIFVEEEKLQMQAARNTFQLGETGQNLQIFEESLFFKLRPKIQQRTVKPTYRVSI